MIRTSSSAPWIRIVSSMWRTSRTHVGHQIEAYQAYAAEVESRGFPLNPTSYERHTHRRGGWSLWIDRCDLHGPPHRWRRSVLQFTITRESTKLSVGLELASKSYGMLDDLELEALTMVPFLEPR